MPSLADRRAKKAGGKIPRGQQTAREEYRKEGAGCLLLHGIQRFFSGSFSLPVLSQDWLPTVQLVLHADWQVLLHSPQPVTLRAAGRAIVLILFITRSPLSAFSSIIIYGAKNCKRFRGRARPARHLFLIYPAMNPLTAPTRAPNSRSSTFVQPKLISPARIANRK